jgi:hypothetical protein
VQDRVTPRTFKDRGGKNWDVWQVDPSANERRLAQRRLLHQKRTNSAERRSGTERRALKQARPLVAPEYAYGWLCFQCGEEKRRLAPVPEEWERAHDEMLEQWCCAAKPVVRRKPESARDAGEP